MLRHPPGGGMLRTKLVEYEGRSVLGQSASKLARHIEVGPSGATATNQAEGIFSRILNFVCFMQQNSE